MKKTMNGLIAIFAIILCSSFANFKEPIGKYGVSNSDNSSINLSINSDHTFYYQDLSNTHKKIMINGTWSIKRGKVFLKDIKAGKKFHSVWAFSNNGKIAKSQKGLSFYRLCKID